MKLLFEVVFFLYTINEAIGPDITEERRIFQGMVIKIAIFNNTSFFTMMLSTESKLSVSNCSLVNVTSQYYFSFF